MPAKKKKAATSGPKRHKYTIADRQAKALAEAAKAGLNRDLTKICKAAGVPRRTLYNWFQDEGFKAKWDALPRQMVDNHLPGIVAAQVEKARKGHTPAARLLFEFAYLIGEYAKPAPAPPPPDPEKKPKAITDPTRQKSILAILARGGYMDYSPDNGDDAGNGEEDGNGRPLP